MALAGVRGVMVGKNTFGSMDDSYFDGNFGSDLEASKFSS